MSSALAAEVVWNVRASSLEYLPVGVRIRDKYCAGCRLCQEPVYVPATWRGWYIRTYIFYTGMNM